MVAADTEADGHVVDDPNEQDKSLGRPVVPPDSERGRRAVAADAEADGGAVEDQNEQNTSLGRPVVLHGGRDGGHRTFRRDSGDSQYSVRDAGFGAGPAQENQPSGRRESGDSSYSFQDYSFGTGHAVGKEDSLGHPVGKEDSLDSCFHFGLAVDHLESKESKAGRFGFSVEHQDSTDSRFNRARLPADHEDSRTSRRSSFIGHQGSVVGHRESREEKLHRLRLPVERQDSTASTNSIDEFGRRRSLKERRNLQTKISDVKPVRLNDVFQPEPKPKSSKWRSGLKILGVWFVAPLVASAAVLAWKRPLPVPRAPVQRQLQGSASLGSHVALPLPGTQRGDIDLPKSARGVYITRSADGFPSETNYGLYTYPVSALEDGEVLVWSKWVSVEPWMRRQMGSIGKLLEVITPTSPDASAKLRQRMPGGLAVGTVIGSRAPELPRGTAVRGSFRWCEATVAAAQDVERLQEYHEPHSAALGALGLTGRTAYHGVFEVLRPAPGQVMFITGASGAVGIVAGQLGKIAGCFVIGSTGSAEKVRHLYELGFDGAFNYQREDVGAALHRLAPNGIDLFFENTGGHVSVEAVHHLNKGARVAISGMIDWAHARNKQFWKRAHAMLPSSAGAFARSLLMPWTIPRSIVVKTLVHIYFEKWLDKGTTCDRALTFHESPPLAGPRFTVEVFLTDCFDQAGKKEPAERRLAEYMRAGMLQNEESVLLGSIQDVPRAFVHMLGGGNVGKQIVELEKAPAPWRRQR